MRLFSSATACLLRIRFGLRALFAITLLLCLILMWLRIEVVRARGQEEAVQAIEAAGGDVYYDYQLRQEGDQLVFAPGHFVMVGGERRISAASASAVPMVLQRLLGSHFLTNVLIVDFWHPVDMKLLPHIVRLKGIRELHLEGQAVDDEWLEAIGRLPAIESLSLVSTNITDEGLGHLQGLRFLRHLGITDARITDAGMAHIESLRNLQELELQITDITYEAVFRLQQVRKDLVLIISTPTGRSP